MSGPIKHEFNARARGQQPPSDASAGRPASRLQIERLEKMMGRPAPKLIYTPTGTIIKYVHSNRDLKIAREIRMMQRALELRRGSARRAFERAAGNTRGPGHDRSG
ncbi:MAG: hypothetical protein ACIAS6_01095 [Phycisphaerales bacterium JB060]